MHAVAIRLALVCALVLVWGSGTRHADAQQIPHMTVAGFLADPGQLLSKYPNGGVQMIGEIRDLAVSDPAVLQPILSLLANTNRIQKFAIGAGFAEAVKIVVRTNQPYSTEIQEAINRTKDQDVILAYTTGITDIQLGTVGGGAGGGGGSGGQINPLGESRGGASGLTGVASFGTANTGGFTGGNGGSSGGGGGGGGTTGTTTTSQSTSP